MADLTSGYIGLKLKNPLVAASCGLTDSIDRILELEDAGISAVVLKSIFEEEIYFEADKAIKEKMQHHEYRETFDYIDHHIKGVNIEKYQELVYQAKKRVDIPIIASVNCFSASEWTYFTKNIEKAGADAFELNMFIMPTNLERSAEENEKTYFEIIDAVLKEATIPVSIKISPYFSNLGQMIMKFSEAGVSGIVLFNRFYDSDVDIDALKVVPGSSYSSPTDVSMPLRWIGAMSGKVKCDLAASTGAHDAPEVIKLLLAGASAVQIASTLYKNGIPHIKTILSGVKEWMDKRSFTMVEQFKGALSQKNIKNPAAYERMQFMKYFSKIQ